MLFEIWVDTDNNTATGSPELGGADYVMQLVRGEISLYKWDGTDYTRRFGDPSAVTLNFAYQAGLTARISSAELGNTKAFKFFVVAISGLVVDPVTGDLDGANSKADVAPGGGVGLFPYTVNVAKPTLVVRGLTTTPAAPKAGTDVHDAPDRGAVGHGCRAPERPGHLHRARGDGKAARAAGPRPGWRGRLHLADTRKREGKDVQGIGGRGLRGPARIAEHLAEDHVAPACASPRASCLSSSPRRLRRNGIRRARSRSAERHRARAVAPASGRARRSDRTARKPRIAGSRHRHARGRTARRRRTA